jgi:hypothetical protein
MHVKATVIVPTFNHGPLLLRAVQSALAQSVRELEIFIVGDGVTDATRAAAQELVRLDSRVRFFDNPKGPSRGELWRHAALAQASGEIVCYLCDDDLWLPDHVEVLYELLRGAHFAGAWPVRVDIDGSIDTWPVSLQDPAFRESLLGGQNYFGLSCGAHTLAFYKSLSHGWRTTPAGKPTDLHMWQQLLGQPGCVAVSGPHPTVVMFPSPPRAAWTLDERLLEVDAWLASPDSARHPLERRLLAVMFRRLATTQLALASEVSRHAAWASEHTRCNTDLAAERQGRALAEAQLALLTRSLTWRSREWLTRLPFVAPAIRQLVRAVRALT